VVAVTTILRPWKRGFKPLKNRPFLLWKASRRGITAFGWMQPKAGSRSTHLWEISLQLPMWILRTQLKCSSCWEDQALAKERNYSLT
jgi:hypothetical protein